MIGQIHSLWRSAMVPYERLTNKERGFQVLGPVNERLFCCSVAKDRQQ